MLNYTSNINIFYLLFIVLILGAPYLLLGICYLISINKRLFQKQLLLFGYYVMYIFVLLLFLGFFYELKKGSLYFLMFYFLNEKLLFLRTLVIIILLLCICLFTLIERKVIMSSVQRRKGLNWTGFLHFFMNTLKAFLNRIILPSKKTFYIILQWLLFLNITNRFIFEMFCFFLESCSFSLITSFILNISLTSLLIFLMIIIWFIKCNEIESFIRLFCIKHFFLSHKESQKLNNSYLLSSAIILFTVSVSLMEWTLVNLPPLYIEEISVENVNIDYSYSIKKKVLRDGCDVAIDIATAKTDEFLRRSINPFELETFKNLCSSTYSSKVYINYSGLCDLFNKGNDPLFFHKVAELWNHKNPNFYINIYEDKLVRHLTSENFLNINVTNRLNFFNYMKTFSLFSINTFIWYFLS